MSLDMRPQSKTLALRTGSHPFDVSIDDIESDKNRRCIRQLAIDMHRQLRSFSQGNREVNHHETTTDVLI